ncbi:hypothetical protein CARUB_v10012589mg [Capsella rubella]|uniref:TF-B3 domain-containing protein n=1 Tax=Capsella rubella TaxID=81985 RepID=R0IEQ7_9BRAS|nr:hypothetical protein CARUB_v10012589mg [Capsella rubella]
MKINAQEKEKPRSSLRKTKRRARRIYDRVPRKISTSSVSHAVSQRSSYSSSRFQKSKVVALFSRTPRWLIQVMRDMNGDDPRLICEKSLIVADVNPNESRLSIPFNLLIRNDFLTPVESRIIEEDINKDEKMGVGAILVDQRTKIWGVILKRWDVNNGGSDYNLVCGWDDVVKANELKHGDYITLWSFRCRGILCFALVPLTMRQRTSSNALSLC